MGKDCLLNLVNTPLQILPLSDELCGVVVNFGKEILIWMPYNEELKDRVHDILVLEGWCHSVTYNRMQNSYQYATGYMLNDMKVEIYNAKIEPNFIQKSITDSSRILKMMPIDTSKEKILKPYLVLTQKLEL